MHDIVVLSIRHGVRALRQAPSSSLVIIVTLAAAIAGSVTAFSVLNATLLQPLPFRDADRVFFLEHGYGEGGGSASPPLFLDHRRSAPAFETLSAVMPLSANLTGAGEPERLRALLVSADFFATFGIEAAHGRLFRGDEEQPGRERVVVISHGFWQRRFGGRMEALGATLQLNGLVYEIVGIAPERFRWGRAYGRDGEADLWAPFALTPARLAESERGNEYLDVYGRLRPGASAAQAQDDLTREIQGLRRQFANRYTEASGFYIALIPLREEVVGRMRPTLLAVFAAVVALVLVAATNVAGLLVARAAGRRREMSVHAALGAGRARLVAQSFGEASVLAAAAGLSGFGLAWIAVSAIERVDRVMLPRVNPIAIDPAVAGFALLVTALVALLAGFLPSWQVFRTDLNSWLRTNPASAGAKHARAGRALIVVQTAVTLALLVAAALLARSLTKLNEVNVGFRGAGVSVVQMTLPRLRYGDAAARLQFVDQLTGRVTSRPGVSAGIISELPLSGVANSSSFDIDGRPIPASEKQPHAETWSATPGYFTTLGVPLKRGRLFDATDAAGRPAAAVVNEMLVARYFPDVNPIGQRIDFEGSPGSPRWREIVGVVGDVRDRRIQRPPEPQIYVPYAQRATAGLFLVTRGPDDPLTAVAGVRAAARAVDPDLPIYNATTMEQLQAADTRDRRIAGTALGGFALAAILVAALGLYGLVAQSVRERVREIGVRVALGADPGVVLTLFLGEGARLMVWGLAAGVGLALLATRLLRNLVFGVTTTDPWSYGAVGLLLLGVGLATCAVPAWRAARLDPMQALRS